MVGKYEGGKVGKLRNFEHRTLKGGENFEDSTNNIQLHTLRNIDKVVSRGSGNPAALLVAGKRQECRFYGWWSNIEG